MTRLLLAPDAPSGWGWERWSARIAEHLIAVSGRFDAGWERYAQAAAGRHPATVLSIRATDRETLVGPLWSAGAAVGCAGCAEVRGGSAARPDPSRRAPLRTGLRELTAAYLEAMVAAPLAAGELVAIGAEGVVRRHRVRRTYHCPICGTGARLEASPLLLSKPAADDRPRWAAPPAPARPALTRRPTCDPVPIRGSAAPFDLDPVRMRRELADPRFGPVTGIRRKSRAPFPMAEVRVLGAEYPGFGRASTFRQAEAVGFLESFERAASVPWQGVLTGVCRSELAGRAIEPTGLGTYTPGQRAAPGFWLRPYHEDAPMDWVPGHRLRDGRPLFVPAEIGFYRYTYQAESPQAAPTDRPARAVFNESSSGSALGASYEEAVLHSLLELAERDAFLISWHRAKPLPEIDPASVADPDCRMLLHMLRSRGYDPHLLVATADIPVPVVWALALRVDGTFPAALSAAGAGPEPVAAVRSALWELGQLVVGGQTLDRDTAGELLADPWSVRELDDHIRLNALPELVPRATQVLGGPSMTLADAFPDWPDRLVRSARGDVTGALEYVADLFATAGLDEIVVVDQTSPDHRDIGLAAVKAVVPGITPMCFGQAHQRLAGLPRLARALRSAEVDEAALPLDPHPFP